MDINIAELKHSIIEIILCIDNFFLHHRYTTAFTVSALKGTAADWIAQRASGNSGKGTEDEELQNKPQQPFQFQYKRNLAFLLYGGFYQGLFGEYLYNDIFSQLFGTDNDMLTAVKKLVFNLVVIAPFLCLPMAYIIKSFIFGKAVSAGVREYIHDVRANSLVKKYWMLWGPVNSLTFSVVPEHMRITFIASISFFWSIFLASVSGKNTKDQ